MTERLCDRANRGPEHRHPDDVPLPGLVPDPELEAPEPVDLDALEAR